MGRTSRGILSITFLVASVFAIPLNSPDDEPVSFVRSAVESNPFDKDGFTTKLDYKSLIEDMLGDESLPLRTAVEDIPYTLTQNRLPLRDAVEFRPIDRDIEDEYKSLRLSSGSNRRVRSSYWDSNPFAAYIQQPYITPIASPLPYRGSPYQQVVQGPAYYAAPAINDFNFETKMYPDPESFVYDESEFADYSDDNKEAAKLGQLKASSKKYQIFCHFTNWAFYRFGEGKFVPENLDPSLCTYIVYSFATLEPQSLTMKEFDPWGDIENREYK